MTSHTPAPSEVRKATTAEEAAMRPQSVPVNAYQAAEALVILAPLPAVTPGDVTVELRPEENCVRFWSHLRSAAPRDYLLNEWSYGGYERAVQVPPGYGSSVEATLHNGQLAIRVLRGEPMQAASIHPTQIGTTRH